MTLPAAFALVPFVFGGMSRNAAQLPPQTKAEATAYAQTSSYADVVAFLDELKKKNPPMRFEWIGKSPLGKDIPLVVVAKNPHITPLQARSEGKLVVYIQANIHAGEVEGKEAVLMLLREIAQNPKHPYLNRMVLLVAPIYNIDGNDKWGPLTRNRPSQDGPDPVGERANGQGLDLNRDCMKAVSNEMSALLENVYNKWDPEAVFDLHTTNGTRHGFVLTYSPPLNPTTDEGVLRYTRDTLLPRVRNQFRKAYSQELFDYGNASRQGGEYKWQTFEEYPRYVSNYAGIRNRVSILSEAASFQPFRMRVEATLRFVKLCLDSLDKDSKKVIGLCRKADATLLRWSSDPSKAPAMGIRFEMDQRGKEKIPLEKPNPSDPVGRGKAPKYFETIEMPIFDRFKAVRNTKFPSGYVFPPSARNVAELLAHQGAIVERITVETVGGGDHFEISEVQIAPQAFQGRRLIRLEGVFRSAKTNFEKGSYLVRTGQPTGLLVFHMMEPESLDGAIAWGFFGESFKVGESAPVVKVYEPMSLPTEVFNPRLWK